MMIKIVTQNRGKLSIALLSVIFIGCASQTSTTHHLLNDVESEAAEAEAIRSESVSSETAISENIAFENIASETIASDKIAPQAIETVNAVADQFYAYVIEHFPETSYFSGIEMLRHDGVTENSLAAHKEHESALGDMLQKLDAVSHVSFRGSPEWITYALLHQELSSRAALQICQKPLWNVNHVSGWQLLYSRLAAKQPVGSAEKRAQSISRWSKLSRYIDQETRNLHRGLERGYSAPKSVVRRVIDQIDAMLALEVEQSPFYSPAARDNEQYFAASTYAIVAQQIYPALKAHRDFLANTYLERARESLSVTKNPNGNGCYEASLRAYTTLNQSGQAVYTLGKSVVAANKAQVIEMGREHYGLEDFVAIIEQTKADSGDRFATKEALLAFSRSTVTRAQGEMPRWVSNMPQQSVDVVPFAEHEEGTGVSAHYRPSTEGRPAEYRIPLHDYQNRSRGNAEATAFHEAWPGHHLQVAIADQMQTLHPVTQTIWFSGPGEGWARYAEGLAEEMGLYSTITGPIRRRAWPARGMVVDPGIHLFGWSREQAVDFMLVSGRFSESRANALLDRIAVLPGQLTAYDSGALEILSLRQLAEAKLGEGFDIGEFHNRILEHGTIPLHLLRDYIEAWIQASCADCV